MLYSLLLTCLVVSAYGQMSKTQPQFAKERFYQQPMKSVEFKAPVQETIFQAPIVHQQQEVFEEQTPLRTYQHTEVKYEAPKTIVQTPQVFESQKSVPFYQKPEGQTRTSYYERIEYPNSAPPSKEAELLGLSAGADEAMGGRHIDTSFSCNGLGYGYFADEKNYCIIYHVCEPREDEEERHFLEKVSYFCPLTTVFDQVTLSCSSRETAIPCHDSHLFYDTTIRRFDAPPPRPPTNPERFAYPMSKTSVSYTSTPSKTRIETPLPYMPTLSKTRTETPMPTFSKTRFETPLPTLSKTRFEAPLPTLSKTRFEPQATKGGSRSATSFGVNKVVGLSRGIQRLNCCPAWAKCEEHVPICSPSSHVIGNTDEGF